jgi:spore maturation protein CgeB
MPERLRIVFFASSLVSAYWNEAATCCRGLARALHGRGHALAFYKPDAFDRLRLSTDLAAASGRAKVIFIAVGTPEMREPGFTYRGIGRTQP